MEKMEMTLCSLY